MQQNNEKEKDLNIEKTLLNLKRIFHQHLLLCNLHLYDTKDKMMDMLRKESGENLDTDFILDLAKNNKIIWVQGSGDNEDPEDFQKRMNGRLAEILSTNLPHTVETLRNLHPCDFCTKTLGKSSNSRSKNAATRTYRFCIDCDMYLCKLCSKTFKKHAEASRLRTKNALETARKKVYASNAKPPRHLLQQTSAV